MTKTLVAFRKFANAPKNGAKNSNNRAFRLTFQSLAASLRNTRFNMIKFYMMLALR
jgi:hypothetical protein